MATSTKQTGTAKVKTKKETERKGSPRSRYLTGDPEQEKALRQGFVVANLSGINKPGATLLTRNHDVIKQWAKQRGASPAAVAGTEHDGHLGVLRFDFPGFGGRTLQHVSWTDWFKAFDVRHLVFVYQETKRDGTQSNFFRFDNPEREEA